MCGTLQGVVRQQQMSQEKEKYILSSFQPPPPFLLFQLPLLLHPVVSVLNLAVLMTGLACPGPSPSSSSPPRPLPQISRVKPKVNKKSISRTLLSLATSSFNEESLDRDKMYDSALFF